MKRSLSAVLHGLGLLTAFGAGWFLKPASSPDSPSQSLQSPVKFSQGAIPLLSQKTKPTAKTSSNWLENTTTHVAAIRAAVKPGEVNKVLLAKLEESLNLTSLTQRSATWQALILEMRAEDVVAVRELILLRNSKGQRLGNDENAFMHQWGKVDGRTAADEMANQPGIQDVMTGWAEMNAPAATAWLESQTARDVYRKAFAGIVEGLYAVDPPAAEALLLARAKDFGNDDIMARGVEFRQAQEGFAGAKQWLAQVCASDAPDGFKYANCSALFSISNNDRPGQQEVLWDLVQPWQNEPWLPRNAGAFLGTWWAEKNPAEGFNQVLRMTSTDAADDAIDYLARTWAKADAPAFSEWLSLHAEHPSFDSAAWHLARTLHRTDPYAAKAWARQIKDPKLRSEAEVPPASDPPDPFASGE